MIRILLVDDHASSRQPLAILLGQDPDTVIEQAGSLGEARSKLRGVDIAIVDLGLPDGDGVELIKEICRASANGTVIVLTSNTDPEDRARAVEAGAVGVLHKAAPFAEVHAAVRAAIAGELLLSPTETVELLRLAAHQRVREHASAALVASLTSREREVLQALADGLADREIAERLNVSTKTVRVHMTNILGKLGLNSRLQALIFAVRHGLVVLR